LGSVRWYRQPQLYAFLFLAAMGAVGFYLIAQERDERIRVICESEHLEQVDARKDAIDGHRRLPQFARFFAGNPEELLKAAAEQTRRQLHTRYGNNRVPSFCKQHDWPEDERQWPPELRTP
jgi:hypothetical protein